MTSHPCREGELIGMDWREGYPRITTHCVICKQVIRRIPFDDIPEKWSPVVGGMVAFMKERRKRES